ncbi:hypothetical protein [Streptomyces synnematoformans]|uniref:Secreted protein n=1 Tax=Streptomyces synnematoformans TaxID=415721 RepID=A0ABN2XYV7_9ACTN
MNWWTLIFAAVAAVASAAVARWEWFDRPQHAWWIRRNRERIDVVQQPGKATFRAVDFNDRHRATFLVHAIGTAIVHNVSIDVVGGKVLGSPELERIGGMTQGSEPFEFDVLVPPTSEGDAWVEIRWLLPRPLRVFGQRIHVRTGELQRWRWQWRSLRLRKRRSEPWWMMRPVRTTGVWVKHDQSPLARIPGTDLRSGEPPAVGSGARRRMLPSKFASKLGRGRVSSETQEPTRSDE